MDDPQHSASCMGAKCQAGEQGQSRWIPRDLELVSAAPGLDHVSAALLGTNRVGTGPGSDCGPACGLSQPESLVAVLWEEITSELTVLWHYTRGERVGSLVLGGCLGALWERFWESEAAESSSPGLLEHLRLSTKDTPRILFSPLFSQLRCVSTTLGLLLRQDRKER